MSRIAVLSDIHFPEQHVIAWPFVLKILPLLNIDKVVLLGDVVDFEPLSRFDVPPDRRLLLQEHINVAEKELLHLRKALPDIPIIWKAGNHENHLQREVIKHPHLYSLDHIRLPSLFHLNKYDVQWLEYKENNLKIGKLLFIHGDEIAAGGQYPARNLYMKITGNVICGHYHKFDRYLHRLADDSTQGAWVNACLRTLHPSWQLFNQWSLGFSLVDTSPGGFFHIEQVLLLKRGSKLWAKISGVEFLS